MSTSTTPLEVEHATTFDNFLELPVELRLIVWSFAHPEARFVRLQCHQLPHQTSEVDRSNCRQSTSTAKVPSPLHACNESREVALKWYRLSFALDNSPRTFYFDWEVGGLITQDDRHVGFPPMTECQYFLETQDRQAITRLLCISRLQFNPFIGPHPPHAFYSSLEEMYHLRDRRQRNLDNSIGSIEKSRLQKRKTSLKWYDYDTTLDHGVALHRHLLLLVHVTDFMQSYNEWLKFFKARGDPLTKNPIYARSSLSRWASGQNFWQEG